MVGVEDPEATVPARVSLARQLLGAPVPRTAALVLLVMICAGLLAPAIAPFDPYDLARIDILDSRLPPVFSPNGDRRYLLGTDSQGADLLSLVLYGLRISLAVAVMAVFLSLTIGTSLGLVSGYHRGRLGSLIMRAADVQFTFPAILLALLIGGIARILLTPEWRATLAMPIVVMALGLAHWPHFARLVRGATLVESNKDYVAAARLFGHSSTRIMLRQVLPNVMNSVFVLATLDLAFAIIGEATLSFLGLGLPPTQPSLGTLLRTGYAFLFSGEWWLVIFPSLTLVVLVMSLTLLCDWLREAMHPNRG